MGLVANGAQTYGDGMNRRTFTASLAALFAAPAVPLTVSPAVASSGAASHFATAKLLARAHNRCSPAMLQRLLRVDEAVALELNAMLFNKGVISSAGVHGTAMAINPLNTHCITNEAMRASNIAQKLADAKAQMRKLADAVDRIDPEGSEQNAPVQGHCAGRMRLSCAGPISAR